MNPFRSFDRIDPPDQWDEIARRAADTDTDTVVDLDDVGAHHPRRRAVALVGMAAAIALVAGGLVATADDGDEDGVATTPSTTDQGAAMDGPCPFTVDPGPPEQDVSPGAGPVEVPTALAEMAAEDPSLDIDLDLWTRGSWGRTTFEGTEMSISVYADGGTDVTPLGPFTDVRLADDARGKELLIVGTSVIEGSPDCRTVQVQLRAGLTEADAALRQDAEVAGDEVDDQIDLDPYFEEHDDLVNRVLGAVRLAEAGPAADAPAPCSVLVDPENDLVAATITAEPPLPYSFGSELGDGRAFTVEVRTEQGEDVAFVEVEGGDGGGGGTRPEGPGDHSWSWTAGDAGILVGWRPPEAVATAAVRPDGSLATEGLVLSPGGSLFALPDVGQSLDSTGEQQPWPIVHCDAAGETILDDPEARLDEALRGQGGVGEEDEELSAQIEAEARAYQDQLAVLQYVERVRACQADPAACADVAFVTTSGAGGEGLLVVDVPGQGLCLVVDGERVACDADLGIGADDEPATARLVTDPLPVWFGRLPDGFTSEDGLAPLLRDGDGRTLPAPGAGDDALWVLSLPADSAGVADAEVSFRLPDSTTLTVPIVGG